MKLSKRLTLEKSLCVIFSTVKAWSFLIEGEWWNKEDKEKEVPESKSKSNIYCCALHCPEPVWDMRLTSLCFQGLEAVRKTIKALVYQVNGYCRQQSCHLLLPWMFWNQNILSIDVAELKQGVRKLCEIAFLACFFASLHMLWWLIDICKCSYFFLASILVILSSLVISS